MKILLHFLNQGADYLPIILLVFFIMALPLIIFLIAAFRLRRKNKKKAKIFFILAGIYLLIGLGICGFAG